MPLDADIFEDGIYDTSFLENDLLEDDLYVNNAEPDSIQGFDAYVSIASASVSFITGSFTAAGHITLHAHWVRVCRIYFSPNGGSLRSDQLTRDVLFGAEIGTLPIPTRTGYTFMGWHATLTGRSDEVFPDEIVRYTRILHARWMITVTFNPNGGVMPPGLETIQIISGYPIAISPHPTRTGTTFGHAFEGWFTAGGARITAATHAPNSNVTYHARWQSIRQDSRHLTFWWHSSTIPVRPPEIHVDPIEEWERGIGSGVSGVNSWNASAAPVNFVTTADTRNRMIAEPRWSDDGYGGWLAYWLSREDSSQLVRFEIIFYTININEHVAQSGQSLRSVVTGVTVHELGHAIGLRDNPFVNHLTGEQSIMTQRISNVFSPQRFDIVSVERLYAPQWCVCCN